MFRFIVGVAVGFMAAHWYYTQGDSMREMVDDMWNRASAPPARIQKADPVNQQSSKSR